jgi:hypothetical protein
MSVKECVSLSSLMTKTVMALPEIGMTNASPLVLSNSTSNWFWSYTTLMIREFETAMRLGLLTLTGYVGIDLGDFANKFCWYVKANEGAEATSASNAGSFSSVV